MNKRPTVTIAIPAYNEEANIGRLLRALLLQEKDNFTLSEIVVFSDGSTDKTAEEVKKIRHPKIQLVVSTRRKGLNPIQNQMLKYAATDILVILNADILPLGTYFLKNLVKPFALNSNIGIVSARAKCISKNTLVSKILANSNELKELTAQKINHGNNVYLCHGQARAFSKAFYQNLKWPYNCPEDAYSYFACLEKGFDFYYAKSAIINFSMSSNMSDHIKQSKRFTSGKKALEDIFAQNQVKASYYIPLSLSISYLLRFLLKQPFLTVGYILILLYVSGMVKNNDIDHSKFEVSKSSKTLNI